MLTVRELNIQLENRPSTLAKVCMALASRNVNILAFQASTAERRTQIHLVVDNLEAARIILAAEGLTYVESEVAQQVALNRPGELARVASRLEDANININYAYAGSDPSTNVPSLFFGVVEVGRATKILDQAAAAAGGA